MPKISKTFLIDLAERTVSAYVVAVVSLLLTADLTNVDAVKAAALAAIPAALVVVKGAAALFVGNPDSAGLLPSAYDK